MGSFPLGVVVSVEIVGVKSDAKVVQKWDRPGAASSWRFPAACWMKRATQMMKARQITESADRCA